MTAAPTTPEAKTPEWMLLLEKKKNRPHRLAHEIGAGAPCLVCGEGCPGLDLHFWRKVCRKCRCKKEEHDVKDDDGYQQFEILLGVGGKRKMPGAILKIKVPEATNNAVVVDKKGVPFDWVPPNVSDDVAAEYMQQLPASKLPISGSDGALYRRQQLERQMPLHDLDAARCHNLTPDEIEELQKYLDNLKSNVVGQGRVTKVPDLYSAQRQTHRGLAHSALPTSHSYQSLPLPPLPGAYNAVPRPFQLRPTTDDGEGLPPPLPKSMPPDFQGANLKTPSSFVPSSGYLPGSQYPQDSKMVNSSEAGGQMLPGTTKPYDPSMPSHQGSLSLQQHPHNVAYSSDVGVQMYPGTTKPYGSSTIPQQGSLSSQQYPRSVAYSGDVEGQMYPNSDKSYHPFGPSRQGSLASQQHPHCVAHSNDVHPMDPSHIAFQNADGTRAVFPHSATIVPSQSCISVAHSSDLPQHLRPGFSQPLASGVSSLSSKNYHNAPNSANITNPVSGLAKVDNVQGNSTNTFPLDGSISAMQHPYDGANSCGYASSEYGLLQDGLFSALRTRPNVVNSTIPGRPGCQRIYVEDLRENGMPNIFPDRSIHSKQNPDVSSGVHSSKADTLAPTFSDSRSVYGNPLCTNAEGQPTQPPQYSDNISNPTPIPGHPDHGSHPQHIGGPQHHPNAPLNSDNGAYPFDNSDKRPDNDSPQIYGERYSQIPEAVRLERLTFRPDVDVARSSDICGDSMPRSAQVIQQSHAISDDLASQLKVLSAEELPVASHLNCQRCTVALVAGEVAVFADRAGADAAWHPKCFACNTCDELLVDLIYFFSKGGVYCGRHFAELLNIPRCYACDELIFVKEYTVAEGKTFHVKHFCCYECDDPLAGKQYIPADDQPTCLDCYQEIFGKRCHTCRKQIPAGHQRVGWKELNWHADPECFRCSACSKSLLGGKFVMREQQPFCNKECVALLAAGKP